MCSLAFILKLTILELLGSGSSSLELRWFPALLQCDRPFECPVCACAAALTVIVPNDGRPKTEAFNEEVVVAVLDGVRKLGYEA